MRTLFLNLASHSVMVAEGACIACIEDDRTTALRFIDHRIGDSLLLPELDSALKDAQWRMEDIERIACVTGPGGFTSLRMAVTLANVLSDQLQIPLAGVHGSEVYEGRMSDELLETRNPSFLWLHSTKKTQLFVRGFGAFAEKWPEAILLSIEEFLHCISSTPVPSSGGGGVPRAGERGPGGEGIPWAGELLPEHEAAVAQAGGQKLPLLPLADALPSFVVGLSYQKHAIEPWYGRGW